MLIKLNKLETAIADAHLNALCKLVSSRWFYNKKMKTLRSLVWLYWTPETDMYNRILDYCNSHGIEVGYTVGSFTIWLPLSCSGWQDLSWLKRASLNEGSQGNTRLI